MKMNKNYLRLSLYVVTGALALSSCSDKKELAQTTVLEFVEAVNGQNENAVKDIYPNYCELVTMSDKASLDAFQKPDSVVVYSLSEKVKQLSIDKYKRIHSMGMPQLPAKAKELYVLYYGKMRFEVVLDDDNRKIIRSFNFFQPANNGIVGWAMVENCFTNFCFETTYTSDCSNKDVLQGFANAATVCNRAWRLLKENNIDSLSLYYPNIRSCDAYVMPTNYSDSCVVSFIAGSSYDYRATYTNKDSSGRNMNISFFTNSSVEKNDNSLHGAILDSYHLFNYSAKVQRAETSGKKMASDFAQYSDMTAQCTIDSIVAVLDARMKYEKKGIVVTSFQTVRGHNRYGESTSGVRVSVFNPTQKTIKYLKVRLIPVNAVGDYGRRFVTVEGIGPVEPLESSTWNFDTAIDDPNRIIDNFGAMIDVIYTDGTKKSGGLLDIKADAEFRKSYWH